MNQLSKQRSSAAANRARPSWFWLIVTGGSLGAHALLLYWLDIEARLAGSQTVVTAMPVELVELPKPAALQMAAPRSKPASLAKAASSIKAAKAASPATGLQPGTAVNSAPVAPLQSSADFGSQIWAAPVSPVPASPAVQPESVPEPSSVSQSAATAATAAAPNNPHVSDSDHPLAAGANRLNSAIASPPAPSPVPPSLPSASPQLVTQPIDVPIPVGADALPSPSEASSDLAELQHRVLVPSHFTASLTATALPSDSPMPDETAQPKTDVKRVSRNSPCRVTPEMVQYLGKTVALQVATDETGQVIHTTTQESSNSPAYDQLAECLVKSWEFRPAIAQGQAVPNDGLVVRITIDPS